MYNKCSGEVYQRYDNSRNKFLFLFLPIQLLRIHTCVCPHKTFLGIHKSRPLITHEITYTGLLGELEHLKIETRLIDEMFTSVMGDIKLEE